MSTQLACERKHSQAWLLWVQTRCPYGNVQVINLQQLQQALLLVLRVKKELLSLVLGNSLQLNVRLPHGPGRKESWQIMFTKDKLLRSPYPWQGQWMWFSMTCGLSEVSNHDRHLLLWLWHISIPLSFWRSPSFRRPAVTRGFRWWLSRGRSTLETYESSLSSGQSNNDLTVSVYVNSTPVSIYFNHIETSC